MSSPPTKNSKNDRPSDEQVIDLMMNYIKGCNLMAGHKPGFAHALKMSMNTIAKERISLQGDKTLTYRYKLSEDIPKATVGLLTALMDELTASVTFTTALPAPAGTSIQFQTELLVDDLPNEIDIVNTVTKMGKTISYTRTDYYCATTKQPLAFSSHVKYMPTGSTFLDYVLNNKRLYAIGEYFLITRKPNPPVYEEKHLWEKVIGPNLEFVNTHRAKFSVTLEHTNGFGNFHGGCHTMVMEQVGTAYAKEELKADNVLCQAVQVDFLSGVRHGTTVDVVCETIGKNDNDKVIHVRVTIQRNDRVCSEGKLRFCAISGSQS